MTQNQKDTILELFGEILSAQKAFDKEPITQNKYVLDSLKREFFAFIASQ